jgi:hypothetical protein
MSPGGVDFHEINGLLLSHLPRDRYKHTEVRKIEMLWELDAASNLDQLPSLAREMLAYG